jgi:NAD(P)-dependent dehydrogenase (short-subunit alcohol dehydrogenase family)
MDFPDMFRLDGQRLFITGGSRGLGREMAIAIAKAGADVIIAARPSDSLEQTANDIRALGRKAWTTPADICDPHSAEDACKRALEEIGPIDILINNVGGRRVNIPTEEMPLDQWQSLMDLNLTSTFVCSKTIGGAMIKRGKGGRIINIASINAIVPGRGIAGRHYEAAKAGVVQLTRSLAVDWAKHSITVNAICPGIFLTEPNRNWSKSHPKVIEDILQAIPQGRLGDPEEIGPLAVYLASPGARYMTGSTLVIDGGYTCS